MRERPAFTKKEITKLVAGFLPHLPGWKLYNWYCLIRVHGYFVQSIQFLKTSRDTHHVLFAVTSLLSPRPIYDGPPDVLPQHVATTLHHARGPAHWSVSRRDHQSRRDELVEQVLLQTIPSQCGPITPDWMIQELRKSQPVGRGDGIIAPILAISGDHNCAIDHCTSYDKFMKQHPRYAETPVAPQETKFIGDLRGWCVNGTAEENLLLVWRNNRNWYRLESSIPWP